ncbi:HD domain-containing phosphohydrolase [Amphritea sp. 1_MG-2023]|uniref:HD-GYP domain-containing protein n=1 Tax=Amphritea sp. 1_MG-2023 TaxID=3062670 RepID=UPI0026E11D46|nr:HD domain-containing phosphohydrolase [Amphritea sp. 1_MG-2023]MDO6564591.1 HD domain-containing phosphohydrolase [Amphritea sp. 1_MG-2023]
MLKPYYRTVLIYLVFASCWVYFSDSLVGLFFHTKEMIILVQNLKGFVFVGITSLLLLSLLRTDFGRIEQINHQLRQSYDQTLQGWVQVMDIRHEETGEHSLRVTRMAIKMAELMGIEGDELTWLARGALMHDAGKVGIPDAILIKPGRLTDEERAIVQQHPLIARDMMWDIEFLKPSVDIPYGHHERWDGSGYPEGLKGTETPLAARMFAVIDVYDALLEERVYKQPWSEARVLEYLEEQAGTLFDPEMIRLFIDHYDEIKASAKQRSLF